MMYRQHTLARAFFALCHGSYGFRTGPTSSPRRTRDVTYISHDWLVTNVPLKRLRFVIGRLLHDANNRSHTQGGARGIDPGAHPGELEPGSGDTTIIGELSPIDGSSTAIFGAVDDLIRPPLA